MGMAKCFLRNSRVTGNAMWLHRPVFLASQRALIHHARPPSSKFPRLLLSACGIWWCILNPLFVFLHVFHFWIGNDFQIFVGHGFFLISYTKFGFRPFCGADWRACMVLKFITQGREGKHMHAILPIEIFDLISLFWANNMKLSIQPNIILLLIYYAELQNQAYDYFWIHRK